MSNHYSYCIIKIKKKSNLAQFLNFTDKYNRGMFGIPVLLIIYNRKELTQRALDELFKIKPTKLFIAADGPKTEEDVHKCKETRELFDKINWECETNRLFQEINLGVALAPKVAIDWFFKHNEMGIILEDDILPAVDFFSFCEELLLRYKDEPKVMHISAMNFLLNKIIIPESYYFSRVISPWGWATWKRAWIHYDYDMSDLDDFADKLGLPEYYIQEFYRCKKENGTFTWDYQWLYSVLRNDGVGIVPSKNLALNIGFDKTEASHTFTAPKWMKSIKLENLEITKHPDKIEINKIADNFTFSLVVPSSSHITLFLKIKRMVTCIRKK